MDKFKKIYNKALVEYGNGNINGAIRLCEKSIALNIKNAPAINLKGLLLYLKGDLNNSRNLWKMNLKLNKDKVAEKYISDSEEDIKRFELYNISLKLIKQIKVNKALDILKKCKESDFNSINVNNYIAVCYMKKGEYDKAMEYISKVTNIDRKNKLALKNKSIIAKYGYAKKHNFKKILLGTSLVVLCGILVLTFKFMKSNKQIKNVAKTSAKKQSINIPSKKQSNKEVKQQKFPLDKLKKSIETKNVDGIYEVISKWNGKDKKLNINEKSLLGKGLDILKIDGGEHFYNKGYNKLNEKNYKEAIKMFKIVCEYGRNSWCYSHAIYMLGNAYENTSNVEEAIKYYSMYKTEIKMENKDYEETVLYKLAILYKNINVKESKNNAKELIFKYPDSMYNNSNLNKIINNK